MSKLDSSLALWTLLLQHTQHKGKSTLEHSMNFQFREYIVEQYETDLIKSVQNVRSEGYFNFKEENGYCFLKVSSNYARKSVPILEHEGFCLRRMIRKYRYPGIYFNLNFDKF